MNIDLVMISLKRTLLVTAVLGYLSQPFSSQAHSPGIPALFDYSSHPAFFNVVDDDSLSLRSSRIDLYQQAFDPNSEASLEPGSRYAVRLFNDQEIVVNISKVTYPRRGSLTAVGEVEGHEASLVVLASVDGVTNGVITIPTLGRFQIKYTRQGRQQFNELDPSKMPFCGAGHDHEALDLIDISKPSSNRLHSSNAIQKRSNHETAPEAEEMTIIDILFLYTESTLGGAGGEAGVLSLIDLAIAEANAVFDNSHLPVRANLIHAEKTSYVNSGSIGTDLGYLGAGRGGIANPSTLKSQFGADLVTLISETDNNGWGGVASILKVPTGNQNSTTSVLNRRWIGAGFFLYVHEMAHNLGCQHDRRNAKNTNGVLSPGVFPYSLGFRFEADNVTHVTVMAYDPGIYLPFFSDPTLT